LHGKPEERKENVYAAVREKTTEAKKDMIREIFGSPRKSER